MYYVETCAFIMESCTTSTCCSNNNARAARNGRLHMIQTVNIDLSRFLSHPLM